MRTLTKQKNMRTLTKKQQHAHLIQTNYFENPVALLWDAFSSRSVTCKIIIGFIHYQYIYQKQDLKM